MADFGLDSFPACFDVSDIRKQEEVLQESYMMVPDSKNRLEQSIGELSQLLVSNISTSNFSRAT